MPAYDNDDGDSQGYDDWKPRIAIVGAGALGCYYGGRLAQHGHDVHFLLRGDYDAVRRNGLVVRSKDGDFTLPADAVHAYRDPRAMPAADLVVVTLKATANDRLEPLVRPLLHDGTAILTLQNGLGNEERLARLFGPQRVLGGIAFVCINRTGPGVIHHSDHGIIKLGEFGGGPGPRASAVARMIRSTGVPCEVLDDLRRGRWEKLVWNVPFNGLGAVLDRTTDLLIGNAPGRALVASLMREVMAAATADGAGVGMAPQAMIDLQLRRTESAGAYVTSMQEDRRHGRAMEIEAILGEPLRRARTCGVPTPYLQMLYELALLVSMNSQPGSPPVESP